MVVSSNASRVNAVRGRSLLMPAAGKGAIPTTRAEGLGDVIRGIGQALGGNPLGGLGTALGFGGGGKPREPFNPCPTGFKLKSGKCVREGVVGTIERILPGGDTGTLADRTGESTVGAFGLPALFPAQVGTITRNDGGVSPILRCRPGFVLGTDDLCYPKAILSGRSKFRKHKRSVRPPITRADMAAINRAAAAQERVKDLASKVGFSVKKRGR